MSAGREGGSACGRSSERRRGEERYGAGGGAILPSGLVLALWAEGDRSAEAQADERARVGATPWVTER